MPYGHNKCTDQPAHPRSLISALVFRCLDIIIPSFYIRNFKPLPSVCGCAGRFETTLVANPEDRFSSDDAQLFVHFSVGLRPFSLLFRIVCERTALLAFLLDFVTN